MGKQGKRNKEIVSQCQNPLSPKDTIAPNNIVPFTQERLKLACGNVLTALVASLRQEANNYFDVVDARAM